MAQQNDPARFASGFERIQNDFYETPDECTDALMASPIGELIRQLKLPVYDPCAGKGKLVRRLKHYVPTVMGTDLVEHPGADAYVQAGFDATLSWQDPMTEIRHIIVTNPPFQKPVCEKIVREIMRRVRDDEAVMAAILLPSDWFSGATRIDLARQLGAIVHLSWRVVWFPDQEKHNNPRAHHSWFVFLNEYDGETETFYAARPA